MPDLVSFPSKYLGVEPSKIDDSDFLVFKFIRPVYFAEASTSFSIEQLPDKPNFKKWVLAEDTEQIEILSSLEVGKIHTLRWLVTPQYDRASNKTKIGYTALSPLTPK